MNLREFTTSGLANISDHDGVAIALTGITIVFVALVLIAVFIALLPRILALVNSIFPPPVSHDAVRPAIATDDGEVLAAIGFICHQIEKQTKAKN